MGKFRIGIVGCGNISDIYIKNLSKFAHTEVTALADLDLERAKAKAEQHGVGEAMPTEELLASPAVDCVVNLTIPAVHGSIGLRALEAGKHVYNEKPFAIERADAQKMLDLAKAKGLRTGCAPDTFLGAGIQTCLELIQNGEIGDVIGAQAYMMGRGPEPWHPDPDFFYQRGGGPMFDMGPYYLTALSVLLGPISGVSGAARATYPTREVGSGPKKGDIIQVNTPTHLAAVLNFESGAIGSITTSFDVWSHKMPPITLHGTEGSMLVGDPNSFGDRVYYRKGYDADWRWVPLTKAYADNSRGLGVLDMALAIQENRPTRASGELAYHVLDVMHAVMESSEQGRRIDITSRFPQPELLPEGFGA